MEDLHSGDLRISVSVPEHAGSVRLIWRGKSTERYPAQTLAPFFAKVLQQATKDGLAIEMHFQDLEHFNSSTISAVIQLIQDARQRKVKMSVIYDPKLRWQKLSFDALRVFSGSDGLLVILPRTKEPAA